MRRAAFARDLLLTTAAPGLAARAAAAIAAEPAASDAPGAGSPTPYLPPRDVALDRLFADAKNVFRARVDPPFVRYRIVVTWETDLRPRRVVWLATLRTADRRLAVVPDGSATPPPEAFAALAPPIVATPTPTPLRAPPGQLHEIARTEVFVRDYLFENVGIETVAGESCYHLLLTPRKEPLRFRLRDLWVTVRDTRLVQLSTQGLFVEPPFDTARWLVQYAAQGGLPYVARVFNVEALLFAGKTVQYLSFACEGYAFPQSVPQQTFAS